MPAKSAIRIGATLAIAEGQEKEQPLWRTHFSKSPISGESERSVSEPVGGWYEKRKKRRMASSSVMGKWFRTNRGVERSCDKPGDFLDIAILHGAVAGVHLAGRVLLEGELLSLHPESVAGSPAHGLDAAATLLDEVSRVKRGEKTHSSLSICPTTVWLSAQPGRSLLFTAMRSGQGCDTKRGSTKMS